MDVICDSCRHIYRNHTNVYGKVCMQCGHIIPPAEEPAIRSEYYSKKEVLRQQVLKKIKERGSDYGNR